MSAFKDKVLPFLKSSWLLIVLGLVALAALPTALFFSSQMNTAFREEFQKKVNADYDSVTKAKNAYFLQGFTGEKLLEKNTEYNAELTQWYADRWKQMQSKTGVVWEEGLKFNKGPHALLIPEGMFPSPPALQQDVRSRELIRAAIEFHRRILSEARAGMPPEAGQVAAALADARAAALARIQAEKGSEPDEAEKARLDKEMLEQRVGRYRSRAAELGVYADASVFAGLPAGVPTEAPSLAVAWDLQERSWAHHDILRAVALANGDAGVLGGVVKRIVRVSVGSGGFDPSSPAPMAYDAGEDKAPLDFSRSVTGRFSGPGSKNRWFDVRPVTLEVVVSSQRLPSFIDALAATNFISVLDVELTSVDVVSDLRDGFVYGDEHVVRATLKLETVWLREWRKDWMPEDVKKALAMLEGVEGGDESGAGAPSSPPRRPPPGGGGSSGRRRGD